eukprot:4397200-Prymnesium_polylepis.6
MPGSLFACSKLAIATVRSVSSATLACVATELEASSAGRTSSAGSHSCTRNDSCSVRVKVSQASRLTQTSIT